MRTNSVGADDHHSLFPEPCRGGSSGVSNLSAYHTHQVIELPVIRPEVTDWRLHQSPCLPCGQMRKALLPSDQSTGYGLRSTAFVGEMSGGVSISRSTEPARQRDECPDCEQRFEDLTGPIFAGQHQP